MFFNTKGGIYKEYSSSKVAYTFPKNAYVEIHGARIPLSGLTVACYGALFDGITAQHFSHITSLVDPNEKNIINTSIYIDDNDISGSGYPSRRDFVKYN